MLCPDDSSLKSKGRNVRGFLFACNQASMGALGNIVAKSVFVFSAYLAPASDNLVQCLAYPVASRIAKNGVLAQALTNTGEIPLLLRLPIRGTALPSVGLIWSGDKATESPPGTSTKR
jgi:hypothetical protein